MQYDPSEKTALNVLHAYNVQRGGGGAGIAAATTIEVLRQRGVSVRTFVRDSRTITPSVAGKLHAFVSGLYAREAVAAFAAELDRERPDLVHTHELYPLISPWILRECRARRIPTVMSAYDFRLTCPTHNHFSGGQVCTRCIDTSEWACVRQNCRGSLAESLAYAARNVVADRFDLFRANVDMYLTPTPFSADWLSRYAGIDRARIRAVPCAVELSSSSIDPAQGKYIGFAGRMVAEKGVDVLVAAARKAELPLHLALGASENMAAHHSDGLITYLQTRSRDDLAAFYRQARCLVVPSIWFETGPLVVGEAMGYGLPVVASNIGALAQMVEHERTGLLFETGNADDLARQLKRLWHDDALCRRLGAAAREHALRTVTAQAHGDAVMQAYTDVLAGAAGRA